MLTAASAVSTSSSTSSRRTRSTAMRKCRQVAGSGGNPGTMRPHVSPWLDSVGPRRRSASRSTIPGTGARRDRCGAANTRPPPEEAANPRQSSRSQRSTVISKQIEWHTSFDRLASSSWRWRDGNTTS